MSRNYAKGQPVGDSQSPIYMSPPAIKALAQYVGENATASSVLTLTQNTTAIEIAAGATPVVMRWVATSDTQASVVAVAGATANFDHAIPANTFRRFVIPIESQVNNAGSSSMMGENRLYGLYQRVAVKTQGIASVLTTEYGRSNSY